MSDRIQVNIPDLGDFADVEVIEVMVQVGQQVTEQDPLLTLETDKAAIDVPTPASGTVVELLVNTGDRLSTGSPVLMLEVTATAAQDAPATSSVPEPQSSAPVAAATAGAYTGAVSEQVDLLVLGAGPGGYTAAFRAADLGREVMLVERYPTLGGVCLNVGCIPSKALLHAAKVVEEAHSMQEFGIRFGDPDINSERLREWKNQVIGRLTGGLGAMARQRKVKVQHGVGEFLSPHHLEVRNGDEVKVIAFGQCIIAAGSQAVKLPMLPDDPRVLDSTSALELANLPERMLIIGGGIIGLELGTVYDALGVKVSVVELTAGLMPGADRDLVRPLQKRLAGRFEQLLLNTKVTDVSAQSDGLRVHFEGEKAPASEVFGAVLAAVGRRPNGASIGAEAAGVQVDERGFVQVDKQQRSNVDHIFAIGDIVGQPMLAHKATHEAKVAAEVACGMKSAFDARVIPSVAYTDPEIAWVGMTELEAKAEGVRYGKGEFPWAASGRSLAINREEGMTKLLFEEGTERVIGAGIVGPNAGDLIAETALAIEMGCDAADIGLTVHPHPTLSETVAMAAEAYEGTITDLYLGGKKRKAR